MATRIARQEPARERVVRPRAIVVEPGFGVVVTSREQKGIPHRTLRHGRTRPVEDRLATVCVVCYPLDDASRSIRDLRGIPEGALVVGESNHLGSIAVLI